MNKLKILITNEYSAIIRNRSFWISTFAVPVVLVAFSTLMGFLMGETYGDTSTTSSTVVMAEEQPLSMTEIPALISGICLSIFMLLFGSQIFTLVKKEKVNRIMEILATCVDGRTMMTGKIITVGLIGLTQIGLWVLIFGSLAFTGISIFQIDMPWDSILSLHTLKNLFWFIIFFIEGYLFFGSLYAACGAITDRDNENKSYMTALTLIVVEGMYVAQYACSDPNSLFTIICSYVPLTSPAVASSLAIMGAVPLWQSILQAIVLAVCAAGSIIFSGKLYTSALLMRGTKLSLSDIILFFKMK